MFDTTKSLKAVHTIKAGGRAELSQSQIVNLIVNMLDATRKLSREQSKAVSEVYDYYRQFKTKELMDFNRYCDICKGIIADFDSVAPYEIYCGDVDVERAIVLEIRKEKDEIQNQEHEELSKAIKSSTTEEYYFENAEEFTTYGEMYGGEKNVIWVSEEKYLEKYQKGFNLFETGRYGEAIEILKESLILNPIGISARFEMCECYIQLHDLLTAKNILLEMKDYLTNDAAIAKFYRRLGFIETELKNFDASAACYFYSVKFENHPSVMNELQYIISVAGQGVLEGDPVARLQKHGVPIIEYKDK